MKTLHRIRLRSNFPPENPVESGMKQRKRLPMEEIALRPTIRGVSERTRRVEVVYRGRVQGVGFRATARSLARPLQITGWVRNAPDGSVILEAQGESEEVGRLLRLIDDRMGSLIRGQNIHDIPPQEGEIRFEIRH